MPIELSHNEIWSRLRAGGKGILYYMRAFLLSRRSFYGALIVVPFLLSPAKTTAQSPVTAPKTLSVTIPKTLSVTLPLYVDSIPNSRPGPDQEKSEINDDGVLVISKVSRPAITVFFPAEKGAAGAKRNGAAVVICPGGGYWVEAANLEGADFARRFAREGVTGIVLKYRLPSDETMVDRRLGALQDAQQAIRLVRLHAVEWGLDPRRIGIMGFSAGGHLAAMEATHFTKALIPDPEHTSLRPDFLILGYPVITCMDTSVRHGGSCEQLIGKNPTPAEMREFSDEWQVTDSTPPSFLVHASDDNGVPPANSILFYEALLEHHVPAELHLYEHSGHGFGMQLKNTSEDWMGRCFHWMEANGWMKAAARPLVEIRY
jgi:acetyl esterase/lipase